MKKTKANKYAIVRFEYDKFSDSANEDNWMLIKYNCLKSRDLFAYEDSSLNGEQYVFDKNAKILYRTDINKKALSVKRNPDTGRIMVRFKGRDYCDRDYFLLYIDPDDDDLKFKMESDEAAILYAMNI